MKTFESAALGVQFLVRNMHGALLVPRTKTMCLEVHVYTRQEALHTDKGNVLFKLKCVLLPTDPTKRMLLKSVFESL